jgi:hypothetical protein
MSHKNLSLFAVGFAVCASACGSEAFEVLPREVHTGFVEGGDVEYVLPLTANDSGATFELEGDCCELDVEAGTGVVNLTTVQAGTATLIATNPGGERIEVPIDVVAYSPDAIIEGRETYIEIGCAGCHAVEEGITDLSGIGLAEFPDEIILRAIRTGINADGNTIPVTHMVNVPDGVVAYVRSLPPRTIPE